MNIDEIDEILLQTLDDQRLSRGEKKALAAIFGEHRDHPERMLYFRHRAFEIARRKLGDTKSNEVVTWLEEVVKALSRASEDDEIPVLAEAYFSPGDQCQRRIVSLINRCRREADICVFTITDDVIANALLEAHNRKVKVRIISDDQKVEDRGSDIIDLARAGIPVKVDDSTHHMHHKFAVFDRLYVVTGSYNWTRSAATYNEENIIVSNDKRLIDSFLEAFETLWVAFS
jgi:mitochondrial cardiolipin hydrolase